MSIINDALKKTQFSLKKKDKTPEPEKKPEAQANQGPSNVYEKLYKQQQEMKEVAAASNESRQKPSISKASKPRPAKKWLQTSATIVVFFLLTYGLFFVISRYTPAKDYLDSIKNKSARSRTRIAQKTQKPRKYAAGELILNGTSLFDGKRIALINDEIYEIGETVDGKKITSISLNRIELRDKDTVTTLRVH